MEAVLLLVRVWRARVGDDACAFRACVSRVGCADETRFFERVDELADYLQSTAAAACRAEDEPPRGEMP